MTTKQSWHEIVKEQLPSVLADFYHPLINTDVVLEKRLEGCDTAYFDFRRNTTNITTTFLDKLHDAGIPQDVCVRGVLKHEIGHYVIYPRECDVLMFLGHFAQKQFVGPENKYIAKNVLAYWIDIMDNLPQILKKDRGRDIRELYKGMNTLSEKGFIVSEPIKDHLKSLDLDVQEVVDVLKKYSVDRLLTAYYQRQGGEDLGVDLSGNEYLQGKLEELMNINYLDRTIDITNFVLFGNIIADVLKKLQENLPKVSKEVLEKLLKPYISDAPDMKDFSDRQIEEGLDEIIKKWGKKRYRLILDYVEGETGKRFDEPSTVATTNRPGLESSTLTFHDEEISYYKRKARTYGIYIHKKPLVVDVSDKHPEGQRIFRVGDPVRTLNPFSTGGRILPGITKRYKEKAGTRKDSLYKVPDLFIWLDTSGSMLSPADNSCAVLAGYILSQNYWENGSYVGVANFSADTAFLFPTRNLDDVYSMLCAYWGGGTVLNISKIHDYIKKIASKQLDTKCMYTTENDYKHLIEHLSPDEKGKFFDKDITVELKDRTITETYEKIDNVIITDGGIANIEEMVNYVNNIAALSRTTIFLIKNHYTDVNELEKLHLPNTQIIPVDKPEDLIGLVIGSVKKIVPEEPKPTSLFYEGRK